MSDFDFSTFIEPPKPTSHRFQDLTGNRYGRLTVIAFAGIDDKGKTCWVCRCECGAVVKNRATNFVQGKARSCGCLRDESRVKVKMIHGHHRKAFTSTEYRSYTGAKNRCENRNNPAYPRYGGRGIEFRFRDFPSFLEHLGPKPKGYSLDRIDNDGHYEPGNVRWADDKTQRANQRVPVEMVEIDGAYRGLKDWCSLSGMKYKQAHARINKLGWCVPCAINPRSVGCPHKE